MVVGAAERARLPGPFDINLAHVLGYLSPITGDELTAAKVGGDRGQRRVGGRPGRVEKEYDAWLRGSPATSGQVDPTAR